MPSRHGVERVVASPVPPTSRTLAMAIWNQQNAVPRPDARPDGAGRRAATDPRSRRSRPRFAEPEAFTRSSAPSPPPRRAAHAPHREAKESLIAADLTIEGKIEGTGHVRIAGQFKGDVNVAGRPHHRSRRQGHRRRARQEGHHRRRTRRQHRRRAARRTARGRRADRRRQGRFADRRRRFAHARPGRVRLGRQGTPASRPTARRRPAPLS